ncbi:pepsin/retropepsin-like aspartic protease family protein [Allosphingosinicella vermicomposti]|uniref:pepsin/retropepsin-like aspartic protease family protein n=1 Tax=Allosphingosinicella vermicomposti TaxID=614671 RepID=UPI00131A54E9|nr:pepsin/retropepsin-like aspartic protease family protein [Allosphingosinicella vermicomposti]
MGFIQGYIGSSGPHWFLVDTGANRSAFDTSISQALALPAGASTKVEGSAGTIEASSVDVAEAHIGGITVHNLKPTTYDLSGSLAPDGHRIAGILGYDALKDHAILFDRTRGVVRIAAKANLLADLSKAEIVPFELDNNIPSIVAAIDSEAVKLRLDTGASIGDGPTSFVNVTEAFYERLKASNGKLEPYTHFTASGAGGEIRIPVVKASSFRVGQLEIREPHLIVQPRTGYFARPDAIGFLGAYAFQSRSAFIVDYPGKRLILLP